jgi:Gluconate 2-dehydrogenase subunit 3
MSQDASGRGFSEDERRLLTAVLDEVIPPSADGRLPGAGELGIAGDVEDALRKLPDLESMIAQGLAELDTAARRQNAAGFAALPKPDRLQLLNEQGFLLPLTFQAYIGYYQHPRVAAVLGLEPRPPHPRGYQLEPNDFTLLDPVRQRGKMYRQS